MSGSGYSENITTAVNSTQWRTYIGPVVVKLIGTVFGGGTVILEEKGEDGLPQIVENGAWTTATHTVFDYVPAASNQLRLTVTGLSGAPLIPTTIQGKYL